MLTETKKKGSAEEKLESGHIILYSGVTQDKRAAKGVAIIINGKHNNKIINWKAVDERILAMELICGKEKMTIIAANGPNENESKEIKEEFWEKLTLITENSRGKIIVAGDLNGRVGSRRNKTETMIGYHGEKERNNNGMRIIDYCMANNLIVTNTFFKHNNIHKFTRVLPSRKEKSIIDYILVERNNRTMIKDVKVKRGAEIYSDHHLLVGKLNIKGKEQEPEIKIKNTYEKRYENIKTYKLQDPEIIEKYQKLIESEARKAEVRWESLNEEQAWQEVKTIIIKAATTTCGVKRNINRINGGTAWWNGEIKALIKSKKKKWQEYLAGKTLEKYNKYKEERTKVKMAVQKAKERAWQEFGEKLETNSKENQKLFYRVLKTLRSGKTARATSIKNKKGKVLTETKEIMERWKEYFKELMETETEKNGNENVYTNEQEKERRKKRRRDENNEEIKIEELEVAIRKIKNGKSPGHDRITAEMVKKNRRKRKDNADTTVQ